MAPVAVVPVDSHRPLNGKHEANGGAAKSEYRQPLRKVGTLDANFKFEEVTPVIGREYPTANIVDDLLNAQNADELLRDLAITSKFSTGIVREYPGSALPSGFSEDQNADQLFLQFRSEV